MKIPNPHQIKHNHYKRCMACGLLGVCIIHVFGGEFIGAFEAVVGFLILYDPTSMA